MNWQTTAPLHHVGAIDGPPVAFGGGVQFTLLPKWLLDDGMTKRISASEFDWLKAANHAFVVQYDADFLGDQEPGWRGTRPHSRQGAKYESIALANFALWLAKPSSACFSQVFHGPEMGGIWSVQQVLQHNRLLCQPAHLTNRLVRADIECAAGLHRELEKVTRDNSVWAATRSSWLGLTLSSDVRYLLLWIALEALFGPDDAREMTFRLAQRIGFFIGADSVAAKTIFTLAKKCYGLRSKVAHGRWKGETSDELLMAATEDLLRRSFLRLLADSNLLSKFTGAGANRENYLDEIVFGPESTSSASEVLT